MKKTVWFVILIIAVGTGLLDYYSVPAGDDLFFWTQLGMHDYTVPGRNTVSFIAAHIFGCNGRLFDYMGPIIINLLPRAAAAAIMGGMCALLFYAVLYVCRLPRKGYTALSIGVCTVALAIIPWWDGMFLRVCHFNYIWTSAFCLLFIGEYFKQSERMSVWLFILGILAGACHEQTAVALCGAFFLLLITGRRYKLLTKRRKLMLVALLAGTVLSVGAPSFWLRLGQSSAGAGAPFVSLLLTTLPLMLLLLAVIAAMMLSHGSRHMLKELSKGSWLVVVTAGVLSGIIALKSGIPGRTGVFSEVCALVAFAQMAMASQIKIRKWPAGVISGVCITFVVLHFIISVSVQKRLRKEQLQVTEEYAASADGIVYFDFTQRYDLPFLTLNRLKGVPDADDKWLLQALCQSYRNDGKPLVILPADLQGKIGGTFSVLRSGATSVCTYFPDSVVLTQDSIMMQHYPGPHPRVVSHATTSTGREIWVLSERVRDPGDYDQPVIEQL